MAAALTSSRSVCEIRNLLVCDICQKTINEPKTLSCSHSFCKACVESLTTQDEGNVDGECKKLACPTCKKTTTLKPDQTVAAFSDSTFIVKLLTAVGSNQNKEAPVCSHCSEGPSHAICMACEELLGHKCHARHDGWLTMQSHTILSLSEIINQDEQKNVGAEKLSCTGHRDAAPKFYCETCKELICMKCVGSVHTNPGHACVAIYEVYCKEQNAVKSKCATINAMLQEGNKALESVKNNKTTQEKTAKDIKANHFSQKDKMMKIVGDGINKILEEKIQEVDKVYDPVCQSLSAQSEKISNYLQKVKESLQRTNYVLENSKLQELLTAQKVIDDDIQMLRNQKPPNLTTFQVQVANQESCMEKLCFYKMFKKLAEDNCPPPDPVLSLMPDTVILKDEKELIERLLSFLNNRKSPLMLCYRASLHGWRSQKFHELCDGKAGTVVLIKVGNWIFGGYTDQTWQVTQGSAQYKTSNASFLFSLRNSNNLQPFKCSIISGKNENAICCHPFWGAAFGGGHDLHIADNANSNQSSYSNLGYTYQPPAGYQFNTPQTQSLFAGSHKFTPTEIEVFY